MIIRDSRELSKEDRVIMVVPRGATFKRCPGKKLKLEINEGLWQPDKELLDYASYNQAEQIVEFVNKEIEYKIKVLSYSDAIALTLETYLLIKQNKAMPRYAIGDAIRECERGLEGVKPELWLAVLIDEAGGLGGDLREVVENYIATGIAVSSKAQIIEGGFNVL